LTREDVSNDSFKFLDIIRMTVGGTPAIVGRISFTGELGYEIYVAPQYQLALFEAIEREGTELGLRLFGGRTLMSLRLEKNWGVWTLDYRPDFTAAESGLDVFLRLDKRTDFLGKAAAAEERNRGPSKRLVTLVVDADQVDVIRDEPIFHRGQCVGYVTSGGYAHYVNASVALGYVPSALAEGASDFEIEILGSRRPARLQRAPLHDPSGSRMKS